MKNLNCPKCFRFKNNNLPIKIYSSAYKTTCNYCNIYLFFVDEKITRIGFVGESLWIDAFYNYEPTMRIVNNNNIVVDLNEPIKDYFQIYKILEKYKDNIIFE